jgi:hypothetical protein
MLSALLVTALAASPPALIGTWEAELNPELVLDLREDGLAAFFQGAFFWAADARTLRLVDPTKSERLRPGDPGAVVTYQIEGDRLTIPFEKDQPVTFVRQRGTARPGPVGTPKWLGNGYAETTSGLWLRKYSQNNGILLTAEYRWESATKIDRGTLKFVCGLTVDASNVFDNGKPLPNIDVASFRDLGRGFCADKTSVRTGAVKQVWAVGPGSPGRDFDVATFEPLLGELVKDKNGVYTRTEYGDVRQSESVGRSNYRVDGWEQLDLPDAATFETPTARTARDRHYEYRIESRQVTNSKRLVIVKVLEGSGTVVDLGAGFQLVDGVISFEGQRLEQAETATFEVLLKLPKERIYRGYWARDRNAVWYGARRVEGADPRTFTVMDEGSNLFAFDAKGRYESGQPLHPVWSDKFEQRRAAWMLKKQPSRSGIER